MPIARGEFTVKLETLASHVTAADAGIARRSIDKRFEGDLEGSSAGEMLSAMGAVHGSAGYVAIERVTGTLHGRSGAFTLQHNATMTRGAPCLNVVVVPDSGSGELAGLRGTLAITIEGGKHFYALEYEWD
jgi:hypothetical protein